MGGTDYSSEPVGKAHSSSEKEDGRRCMPADRKAHPVLLYPGLFSFWKNGFDSRRVHSAHGIGFHAGRNYSRPLGRGISGICLPFILRPFCRLPDSATGNSAFPLCHMGLSGGSRRDLAGREADLPKYRVIPRCLPPDTGIGRFIYTRPVSAIYYPAAPHIRAITYNRSLS